MEGIMYRPYAGESDLQHIMALVQNELSEPYVIYTYRYFLHQWYVCFMTHYASELMSKKKKLDAITGPSCLFSCVDSCIGWFSS